jgi:hypothetical protein
MNREGRAGGCRPGPIVSGVGRRKFLGVLVKYREYGPVMA